VLLVTTTLLSYANADAGFEKAKADELMERLGKKTISKNLMKQLKRIAGELSGHYSQRPDPDYAQWVVATSLDIQKTGNSDTDPLTLTKQEVVTKHIYSNFKKKDTKTPAKNVERKKFCDAQCLKGIEKLPTKIKKDRAVIADSNVIHTEIQMSCRKNKDNILKSAANKNKVILIYSKYIPCSQNQNSHGGTFVECAGELANYVVNKNTNGNKFIVFYETTHEAINEHDGVKVSSVFGVSQLYMEMSGIVAFKYTYTQSSDKLVRDPLHINRAAYFRKHPKFLSLGRPLLHDNYKATSIQMFIDCL